MKSMSKIGVPEAFYRLFQALSAKECFAAFAEDKQICHQQTCRKQDAAEEVFYHPLKGGFKEKRACHIEDDWLLILCN